MLVVQRKCGEAVFIGRDEAAMAAGEFVEVRLVSVKGKARIGIDAHSTVRVLREELLVAHCQRHGLEMAEQPTRSPFAPPAVPADSVPLEVPHAATNI